MNEEERRTRGRLFWSAYMHGRELKRDFPSVPLPNSIIDKYKEE